MRKRWLIGGIILCVALGAAYTGYWFWLARTFEQQLALWIEQQRASGYTVVYSEPQISGFPFRMQVRVLSPEIGSLSQRTAWRWLGANTEIFVAPWQPLNLTVNADGKHELVLLSAGAHRRFDVILPNATAEIDLSPSGQPKRVEVNIPWAIVVDETAEYEVGHINWRHETVESRTSSLGTAIVFRLIADSIPIADTQSVLGSVVRHAELEGRIQELVPANTLRATIEGWREIGGTVEVTRFAAGWGPLALTADGTLALDQSLQPIGAFTATVRGYNETVDAAVAAGYMTTAQGAAAKVWLNSKAETDDGGSKVKLPITIQDGFVSMGPVKLAQLRPIEWQ